MEPPGQEKYTTAEKASGIRLLLEEFGNTKK